MIVLNKDEREQLQKKLFECNHAIPSAGAKALDAFGDTVSVLMEVIEHLSRHVLLLEKSAQKSAQKKAWTDVSSLIVAKGEW